MKKLFTFLAAVLFTAAVFAQDKVIIRLENPLPMQVKHFAANDYDIASYRPGEYLDIVVTETEFSRLVAQGYRFTVFQTEAEMAANLAPADPIPGYRTYAVALAELQQIVIDHPTICKLYDIGDTRGKEYYNAGNNNYVNYQFDIWALKVSSNVELSEDEPAVFYMGLHHAREPLSLEVTFYVLNHLLQNYGVNPEITNHINSKELWFIPNVNPDGHKIVMDQINTSWRKNIRDNDGNGQVSSGTADGVDPNRNYDWQWGVNASHVPSNETYCGPAAWSEPEIAALRDFMASRHFVSGISYHTYGELVLWPYGYENNAMPPDNTAMAALGTAMAQAIPSLGSGTYTPQPSWQLYPHGGILNDYAYGKHGIFCYTIELATQFIPPSSQVQLVCQNNLQAALILLARTDKSTLTGLVTNSVTGEPVVAEIYIQGIDNTGMYRDPYTSRELFGRYYRILPNGNFSVTFSAFGYISQTFNNVNINNLNQTILNVQLVPSQVITITGTVTDADSGLPIENASIEVIGTPLDPVYTNSAGQYIIPEIFENTYTFRVHALDYITVMQEVTVTPQNNVVNFQLTIANAESFEGGVFPPGWTFTGNLPWVIDNTTAWDGTYAARSGAITHNQSSSMSYSMETDAEGLIIFYRKVSSEASYDFLKFYINDQLQGQWSGNLDWEEVSFPVTAGYKTFRWTYSKDGSVSTGSDKAWVDFIIFPLPASCSAPANLNASSITATSAQLNWMAGGDETMWDLSWGAAGFNPSQGTIVEDLTTMTYQLENISPVTAYEFYVRSHCTNNQLSAWAGPAAFTTLCDVFSLPYTEPFGTPSVSCWTFPEGQGNWAFGTSYTPPSSVSGAPNAFFSWTPSVTNYSFSLTSPLMNGTEMSSIKLDYIVFINSYSSSSIEQMAVEYKELNDNTWTLLENFTNTGLGNGNAEYVRENQVLNGMAGKFFQIRFRAHGANSYNINGWGLDDIHVHGEGGPVVIPGDSNCDGLVNVLDVITTVNYITGTNPQPFCFENADVTSDGSINVLDVIGTVNIITGGKNSTYGSITSDPAHIYVDGEGISLYSDGTLAGLQFEISGIDPAHMRFLAKDFEFAFVVNDDLLTGIIFSFDNTPLPAGRLEIFAFNRPDVFPEIRKIIAGNQDAREVKVFIHKQETGTQLSRELSIYAYPNPSKGHMVIELKLPQSTGLKIAVLDIMGRELVDLFEGNLPEGNHYIEMNEASQLPAGIYMLKLHAFSTGNREELTIKTLKFAITD